MESLPNELYHLLSSYLCAKDVVRLSGTGRGIRRIVQQNGLVLDKLKEESAAETTDGAIDATCLAVLGGLEKLDVPVRVVTIDDEDALLSHPSLRVFEVRFEAFEKENKYVRKFRNSRTFDPHETPDLEAPFVMSRMRTAERWLSRTRHNEFDVRFSCNKFRVRFCKTGTNGVHVGVSSRLGNFYGFGLLSTGGFNKFFTTNPIRTLAIDTNYDGEFLAKGCKFFVRAVEEVRLIDGLGCGRVLKNLEVFPALRSVLITSYFYDEPALKRFRRTYEISVQGDAGSLFRIVDPVEFLNLENVKRVTFTKEEFSRLGMSVMNPKLEIVDAIVRNDGDAWLLNHDN